MAIVKLQKAHIIGKIADKSKILKALQDFEVIQLEEVKLENNDQWKKNSGIDTTLEMERANLEFTIGLLAPFAKKRSLLEGPIVVTEKKAKAVADNFDHHTIIKDCKDLEVRYTNAKTTLELLDNAKKELAPWKNSKVSPKEDFSANGYEITFIIVSINSISSLENDLNEIGSLISLDIINTEGVSVYATLIYKKEYSKSVKDLLSKIKVKEVLLPTVQTTVKDALHNITEQESEANKTIRGIEKEFRKMSANYETLQIVHDYHKWQVDAERMTENGIESKTTFAYSGWLPKAEINEIENMLRDKTNNKVAIIPIETDEPSPVALKNHPLLKPLENVTKLYGLPIPTEYDPTALLSVFFIVFFGMAVTDAGYGIIMSIMMLLALKYVRLSKQIKSFVRLLLYAGILTIIMGILYGSWFGMTIEQAPAFLTTRDGENLKFIGQIFNPIEDPMTVLIFSLVLGYLQVSFGVLISFLGAFKTGNKKDAIIDQFSWFLTLVSLSIVIMGQAGLVGTAIGAFGLYLLYFCLAFLVLTQGRSKPSIPGKIISGVLSLYGLVGYFGDILSYSRLLALGLATAIIGLAVNVVAGLVSGLPYIGWLVVLIVLIGGHSFNLVVNALGAFIHSARLQYVEFFSKFLVGGGKIFKPFKKESKYVMLESDM
ncbi:MAG: V-type ATP synthase subunit I [Candidatus Peregrinibacteria bacterium]|nr:V-type ATP synthase subunit I [Candidatus Peregrinibacteria bacterium]MDZ4245295.1 V-type ATP synthase subunit I [Candidatus Gracilibacteria bacterium]